MKRTYSINLGGTGFIIDEDAYQRLGNYLDTLTQACAATQDQEVAFDIEQRIAEIFSEKYAQGGIIGLTDVETVIKRMGGPEEIIETRRIRQQETEETVTETIATPPKVKKRLFRDTDNKMLGGVCSGIACYFGIDVVWVRIIAVGLCFLSASTLALVYILLWIIIPAAKTPLQKMQMTGGNDSRGNAC